MPRALFLVSSLCGLAPLLIGARFISRGDAFGSELGLPWPTLGRASYEAYSSTLGVRDLAIGVAFIWVALSENATATALSFAGSIAFLFIGDFLVLSGALVPHASSTLSPRALAWQCLPLVAPFCAAIYFLGRENTPRCAFSSSEPRPVPMFGTGDP
jgi:hypothetical protein